jgi:hypothetical protein
MVGKIENVELVALPVDNNYVKGTNTPASPPVIFYCVLQPWQVTAFAYALIIT